VGRAGITEQQNMEPNIDRPQVWPELEPQKAKTAIQSRMNYYALLAITVLTLSCLTSWFLTLAALVIPNFVELKLLIFSAQLFFSAMLTGVLLIAAVICEDRR
jgi:hypothetical protein